MRVRPPAFFKQSWWLSITCRKHKDVGVRDVATRLIKAWRVTVEKEAEPKSKATPLPAPSKDAAAKPFEAEGDGGGAAGHGPVETAAATGMEGGGVCETETKQVHEVDEEQKVHESVCDDDLGSDLDPSRRKIGEVLGNAVSLAATSDDERRRARRLGFEIEAAMAAKFPNPDPNTAVSNGKLYKQKARSLNFNLKDANNPDLRARVLNGDISPAILCALTSEELASDNKRDENVAIRKKMLEENIRGQQQQASTDQFKCAKCKQRKTTFYQLQTRSADEPMTTFVTCVNCGNRWKFC